MGDTPTTIASGQAAPDAGDLYVPSPPPPGSPEVDSIIAFGMAKSGSVLLQALLNEMSLAMGLVPYNPEQQAWEDGYPIHMMSPETAEVFKPTGYMFGVFRQMPSKYELPILETHKSVSLIRDPRDMLVSHYFSMKKSHPRPGDKGPLAQNFDSNRKKLENRTVDEHCIATANWFLQAFMRLNKAFNNPLCKVYRYEDIIFSKREWVRDLADHFGWTSLREQDLDDLADRHDIRPKKEDPSQHIRSVTPGDHRNKLKPETIERLDETFKKFMDRFGYEASA